MKMIDKSYVRKDPKIKENLQREIKILKLMAGCEYVVKMIDAQVIIITKYVTATSVFSLEDPFPYTYSRTSLIRTPKMRAPPSTGQLYLEL